MLLAIFLLSALVFQGALTKPLFEKVNDAMGSLKTGISPIKSMVGNAHGAVGSAFGGAKSKVKNAAGTALEIPSKFVGSGIKTGSESLAAGFNFIGNGFKKLDNAAGLASAATSAAGVELQNKWKNLTEERIKKLKSKSSEQQSAAVTPTADNKEVAADTQTADNKQVTADVEAQTPAETPPDTSDSQDTSQSVQN